MNFKAFSAFFAQYYERIVAMVVLLALVLFSVWLLIRVNRLQDEIGHEGDVTKGPAIKTPDMERLKDELDKVARSVEWTTNNTHRLFIGPDMVASPEGALIPGPPIGGSRKKTPEGIDIDWLKRYRLPTTVPVANTDPDNDGFTVMEEFEARTDPTDPADHPDYALKLRLYGPLVQDPFPFVFSGVSERGGELLFSLQRLDQRGSFFVKLNNPVPDKQYPNYKVINYAEKFESVEDRTIKMPDGKSAVKKVDVSELTVQKEGSVEVVLIKGRQAKMPDLAANLIFLLEQKTFKVTVDTVFALQNSQYQVLTIKRLDDGKPKVLIQKLDPTGKPLESKQFQFELKPYTKEDQQRAKTPATTPSPGGPGFPGLVPNMPDGLPTGFPPTPPPPR